MTDLPGLYGELGLRPVVNAMGPVTFLGGAPMRASARSAMAAVQGVAVDVDALQAQAGARIASILGAEAAMVTTGAAGGLLLATAACVAGTDRAAAAQLPVIQGGRDEVVIHRKQRFNFDHAVRMAGVRLVDFGDSYDTTHQWELEAALSERTAAVVVVPNLAPDRSLSLSEVAEVAAARNIPVIVDAANCLPPKRNLRAFFEQGATLVSFSGGKVIGGPQSSGILAGREDLVKAALANTVPNHNTIGRPLKVDPAEIVALLAALEEYASHDEAAQLLEWKGWMEDLSATIPGSDVVEDPLSGVARFRLRLEDPETAIAVDHALANGDPVVRVIRKGNEILCDPMVLEEDQVAVLATALAQALEMG